MTLLVSAVIPAFNAEQYVADAVRSVLGQSYASVECIVVDDGSRDGTSEAVRAFGSGIRLIRVDNGGVSRARNIGAAAATGDVVAFLDADDAWLPKKLEIQVEALRPDVGLLCSGYYLADDQLTPLIEVGVANGPGALEAALLFRPPSINVAQTGVVPKAVFERVRGFDERLSTSADLDLAIRIARHLEVVGIQQPLALYRTHDGQMHADIDRMERDMLLSYDDFFADPTLPPEIRRLRRRAFGALHTVLAASYAEADQRAAAVRSGARAMWWHPPTLAAALARRARRRRAPSAS